MQYYVVQRRSLTEIMTAVNKFIEDGWVPVGGLCYSPYYSGTSEFFYQAMVKK